MIKKENLFIVLLLVLTPILLNSQDLRSLNRADLFMGKSVNDSAIYYFEKGFKECNDCNTIKIANYYLKYAKLNKTKNNNDKALDLILKAEKIFTSFKDNNGLVRAKVAQAELFRYLDNYEKGNRYLSEAKRIINNNRIDKKVLLLYYDREIALKPKNKNTANEIIALCKKNIIRAKEVNDFKIEFSTLNELGYTYIFINLKKQKEAYLEALKIARKHQLEYQTCDVLFNLGINTIKEAIALKKEDKNNKSIIKFNQSIKYLKEALDIATKLDYIVKQQDVTYFLYLSNKEFNKFNETIKYLNLNRTYEIKRIRNDRANELLRIESKYLNNKKDLEISKKESKIRIQNLGLLFLGISIISLFYFLRKTRNNKFHTEQILLQKTILLKEVHHRVKNNLQVISSLLYLQANKYNHPEITAMVTDSQKHIDSIAIIHELLYKNNDIALIPMSKYFKELCNKHLHLYLNKKVDCKIIVDHISLPIDYATPLGLILNELLSNSLKHAFKNIQTEKITIFLENITKNEYRFIYKDNGVGMDLTKDNSNSLGLKLIKMFAEEMDATIVIENDNGLSYTLTFKSK